MTSDADEIRLIEAQDAPTRFARGWHCLGLIRDFGDGKPHAINAFGQKLVVFRSGDGKINVLDGYCRHMGGDLSQGTIKGDEISFQEDLDFNGQTIPITYTGTVSGDEIKLHRKVGTFAEEDLVAKRVK